MFVLLCSGRLIRTLADAKYGNLHLTKVEIIYNIISFVIAVITTIAFTVYAKRALDEIQKAETNGEDASLWPWQSWDGEASTWKT
jgi:uncharacterized membrane protein